MNDTITPTRPGSPGRLVTGLAAVAAGALLGAFGAVTVIELGVAAQPVPSVDGTEWGSPGHITMSADAIEQWIKHRTHAPSPYASLSADAAERALTP